MTSPDDDDVWRDFEQWPTLTLKTAAAPASIATENALQNVQLFSLPNTKKIHDLFTSSSATVAPTAVTSVAPSAGKVTIHFTYDGSLLAPTSQQGRVVIAGWSSLNRITTAVPVSWKENTGQTKSREATITLPLQDEYMFAEQKRAGSDKPTYKLGSLRTDSNVWFEALVEEPSLLTNQAVYGRTGAGFLGIANLVELSRQTKANARLPLVLFGQIDPKSKTNLIKGYIQINKVDFGSDTQALHRLADSRCLLSASPSRFEINAENLPFIASMNATSVGRALYDVANEDNYSIKETRAPNNRIRMPWFQTHQPAENLNRLPIHAFFLDAAQLNPLPSDAPDDEKYLLDVFGLAFKRRNMTLKEAERIMTAQMLRTDAQYDPDFTECLANIARGFVLFSNTLPYQADIRNLARRVDRYTRTTHSEVEQVESLDVAQQRGGGDCEDLAKLAYVHSQMLRRGTWNSPFLQIAQRAANLYDTCMMLGSVTSPALGNEHHDANKTAVHLADAEHHHAIMIKTKGKPDAHFVRSEGARVLHKHTVRGSPEDLQKPVGGHSWSEMIPKHKFMELVRRITPETSDGKVSKLAAPGYEGPEHAPWKYFIPHMVIEGTGRINPLLMAAPYYASPNQDRDQMRQKQLASMRTFHAIISASRVFHSMQSEAQPTNTVNTPHERLTEFYMQSTQCFTDAYLEKTGTVSFNWVQIDVDEPVEAQPVDPLFEKQDALAPQKLATAAESFLHSAAANAIQKDSTLAATTALTAVVDETLAVGALVGMRAVQTVDPAKVSLGVDLEQRIMDRPIAANIALQPFGELTRVEAKVLASQMRQVYPGEVPSKRLSFFSTDPKLKIAFVRQSTKNPDEMDASAMARIVHNDKLVDAQRRRVTCILDGVRQAFVNTPWLTRTAAAKRNLNLQTFFFAPHDLVAEQSPIAVIQDVLRLKEVGVAYTARAYVEEPTSLFQTVVIQLLCNEVKEQIQN